MAAWISSLDATASSNATSSLWMATAIVAAHLVFRMTRER
jgi:hypothetical protein